MRNLGVILAVAGVTAAIALGVRHQLLAPREPEARPRPAARASSPGIDMASSAARYLDGGPQAAPPEAARAPRAALPEAVPAPHDGAAIRSAPEPEREPARRPAAREVQGPDASEILRRAAAAYGRIESLRADFVQRLENPLLGMKVSSRGTLFQQRPDRFLMRFEEPAGDIILSDGRHFWIYYPSVDARQVIRAPVGPAGAGGADLQAQFLGDPVKRFAATLQGTTAVARRSAYVLELVPREPLGYQKLKVWINTTDYLVRRFELTEESGAVRRVDLQNLEINPRLAEGLFRFTPPRDARVIDRG